MKRSRKSGSAVYALLFAGLVLPFSVLGEIRSKVIYGEDHRLDLHQVENPKLKALADSSVALFRASKVKMDEEEEEATLALSNFGDSYNLCEDEPFRDQPNGAFCSGSLVGDNLVMTAGHCIRSQESCEQTRFVFGFGLQKPGAPLDKVPSKEVYKCSELVTSAVESGGPDYALVRLDRAVMGHAPLKISRRGAPPKGAKLLVIGHPAGLPTKIAGGASVRDNDKEGYFVANLDTYGGNSGSAVFNEITGEIEGILVRGETDFEYDLEQGCRRSKRCEDDSCRGEDVTSVGQLAKHIPKLGSMAKMESRPGPAFSALKQMAEALP